jgi:hypothetical protein
LDVACEDGSEVAVAPRDGDETVGGTGRKTTGSMRRNSSRLNTATTDSSLGAPTPLLEQELASTDALPGASLDAACGDGGEMEVAFRDGNGTGIETEMTTADFKRRKSSSPHATSTNPSLGAPTSLSEQELAPTDAPQGASLDAACEDSSEVAVALGDGSGRVGSTKDGEKGQVRERSRRSVRPKENPDFLYTYPKDEKAAKRRQKKDKMSQMKSNPEKLHYDLLPLDDSPCDVQFYTTRLEQWRKECELYYNDLAANGEVGTPHWRDLSGGTQLIVPMLDSDVQSHLVIAFYTKNMRVFVQGASLMKWMEHNFMAIKQRLDGVSKNRRGDSLTVQMPKPNKSDVAGGVTGKTSTPEPRLRNKHVPKNKQPVACHSQPCSVALPPMPVFGSAQQSDMQGATQNKRQAVQLVSNKKQMGVWEIQPQSVALPPQSVSDLAQSGKVQGEDTAKTHKHDGQQFVKLPQNPVYGTGKGSPAKKRKPSNNTGVSDTTENILNNTMCSVSSISSTESDMPHADGSGDDDRTTRVQTPDPPLHKYKAAAKLKKIESAHAKAVKELKEKVAYLEIELSKKDIDLERLKNVESDNKNIKKTVTKQKREINKLSNRTDELLKSNSALKIENSELSERNQELKKDLDRLADVTEESITEIDSTDNGVGAPHEQEKEKDDFQLVENNKRNRRKKDLEKKTQQKTKKGQKEKVKIVLCGDSNVRGLGSLVQSEKVDGMAVVHSGFKIQDLQRHMSKDIPDHTDMIFMNCGTNNIEQDDFIDMVCKFDSLLDNASNKYKNKEVVMLSVPPVCQARLQGKVRDINDYLYTKCKKYDNVMFLDCGLNQLHLGPDSIHLNQAGRTQVAKAIVHHAECRV